MAMAWPQLQAEVMSANRGAMEELRRGEPEEALRMLNSAQELLETSGGGGAAGGAEDQSARFTARAVTASGLAKVHKRARNHVEAAQCLESALELYEAADADLRTLVAAHLNLAACYLDAEAPQASLQRATTAVQLGGRLLVDGGGGGGESPQGPRSDDYAMLAVAYHKTAEAHEALREWGSATLAYTQAYEVVRRSLGPDHHLTKSFERSARCPRRPCPPEVPSGWRARSATPQQKRLPVLPSTPRSRPLSLSGGLEYKLNSETFPSWPPRSVSREEQVWYELARQHREQVQAKSAAKLRGIQR